MSPIAFIPQQRRVKTIEDIAALPLDTESGFVSRLTDLKFEALSRLTLLRVLFRMAAPESLMPPCRI